MSQKPDSQKKYPLEEAAILLPKLSTSKFVGSVDIDVVLNISDKQKKESVKGTVIFPHPFGKEVRVLVLCEDKDVPAAKAAGAVDAGLEELVKKIEAGKIEFDVVLASPTVMAKVARLGKVLGPKGLMPNPANDTVTNNIPESVHSFKSGKQTFKMSEQGVVRMRVAKLDQPTEAIIANISTLLKAIQASARKLSTQPFKKISLSPTMGSSVKLDVASLTEVLK